MAYAEFHESVSTRTREVPFEGATIRVISGEDLVVFKMLFGRPRDWFDIQYVLHMQGSKFDVEYTRQWLVAMVGEDDGRVTRFDELVTDVGAGRPLLD
ncbi:MAG: hypothetical protein HYX53_18185 [Chloroflexi bacterium]|nr:hypothetical protein [Chloroflexota bacterium]